mgnify:CR=1 FL=1
MSLDLQLLNSCTGESGPGGGARGWQQSRKLVLVISADDCSRFQSGPKWRVNHPVSPIQKPSWDGLTEITTQGLNKNINTGNINPSHCFCVLITRSSSGVCWSDLNYSL